MESRPRPVNLIDLAAEFGVDSVEEDYISSLAMLVPIPRGYKVVLKKGTTAGEKVRQRFSLAHELGHLLLRQLGHSQSQSSQPVRTTNGNRSEEEKLCDQIAVEILLPRTVFSVDAAEMGWSLDGLRRLTNIYGTSVQATASRLISLAPETCHMAIWRPSVTHVDRHELQHSWGRSKRYGIPNQDKLHRRQLWLVARSDKSSSVESGCCPMIDRDRLSPIPNDVPAQGWAWGRGEFRRVIVFYYPERELTVEMLAISNATRRAL